MSTLPRPCGRLFPRGSQFSFQISRFRLLDSRLIIGPTAPGTSGWMMQLNTYESLQVGESFAVDRYISEDDVATFARLTGDDNPIHVDPDYAADTRFGRPIVHGVLLLGIISKVLGRDFPGHGSVAVGISCRFLRPVPVGSTVRVEVRIVEKIEKRRHIRAKVYAYLDDRMVLGGEATLIPPEGQA